MHDLPLLPFTRDKIYPGHITLFFAIQAVALGLERAVSRRMPSRMVVGRDGSKQMVKRRVGGLAGWVWTMAWLIGTSTLLVEGWNQSGVFEEMRESAVGILSALFLLFCF